MLTAARRDRLIGATFLGAIWTTLSSSIVCGLNPIGGFVHDLGLVASAGSVMLAAAVWIGVFYGILTLCARRRG